MFTYGCKYYARQLLKQCHVSIFNLDVLENIYEMDDVHTENINFEVSSIFINEIFYINCFIIFLFLFVQEHLGLSFYDAQGSFLSVERDEKWNFEESFPERVISAHKGAEMSVLLSMAGAIQRPHIGEYYSNYLCKYLKS